MQVGGRQIATIPPRQWVRVEIEAQLGKGSPRTFTLRLTPAGAATQLVENIPFAGAGFVELHWLGFSSTAAADTAFFLDNLAIEKRAAFCISGGIARLMVGLADARPSLRCVDTNYRPSRGGYFSTTGAVCSGLVTPGGSSMMRIERKWISAPSDSRQR